jgi:hypothetical protein
MSINLYLAKTLIILKLAIFKMHNGYQIMKSNMHRLQSRITIKSLGSHPKPLKFLLAF